MDDRRWILIPPAIWIACLLTIHILGALTAPDTSEIPDDCPENSNNCERLMMAVNASPEALHQPPWNGFQFNLEQRLNLKMQPVHTPYSILDGSCSRTISLLKQDVRKTAHGSKSIRSHEWDGATWV